MSKTIIKSLWLSHIFPYCVPKDSPNGRESTRVLVIFGGRNTTGQKEASGQLGFGQWADEHGIFLVCPGFNGGE